MLHTDAQIEELDAVLTALPPESVGMLASEFDGFVTGVLLCPEMILPSEWLPRVWGDPELAVFESDAAAQRTVAAVMNHYNRVARGLSCVLRLQRLHVRKDGRGDPRRGGHLCKTLDKLAK